jgi:predicted AAA+ superfamily ATPase
MNPVEKPVLLRQLLRVACEHSGQVLAFNKMLGQLHDAGNVTTLAHYLELLAGVGMVAGLQKYSGSKARRRASSPKLLALNTALMGAVLRKPLSEVDHDPALWGRFVETAVGAHLVNSTQGTDVEVSYWREGNAEVDYVLSKPGRCLAIEVKSGRPPSSLPGLDLFHEHYRGSLTVVVGPGGMPLEEFFSREPSTLL